MLKTFLTLVFSLLLYHLDVKAQIINDDHVTTTPNDSQPTSPIDNTIPSSSNNFVSNTTPIDNTIPSGNNFVPTSTFSSSSSFPNNTNVSGFGVNAYSLVILIRNLHAVSP